MAAPLKPVSIKRVSHEILIHNNKSARAGHGGNELFVVLFIANLIFVMFSLSE